MFLKEFNAFLKSMSQHAATGHAIHSHMDGEDTILWPQLRFPQEQPHQKDRPRECDLSLHFSRASLFLWQTTWALRFSWMWREGQREKRLQWGLSLITGKDVGSSSGMFHDSDWVVRLGTFSKYDSSRIRRHSPFIASPHPWCSCFWVTRAPFSGGCRNQEIKGHRVTSLAGTPEQ